jgi:plasmid stabilization system protein ParE
VARKVVWTEPAADDLVETIEYIARDSPAFATTLAQRICDAGDSLPEMSQRGRPFPDPAYPGFRELIVGPYRLVYEVVWKGLQRSRTRDLGAARRRGEADEDTWPGTRDV